MIASRTKPNTRDTMVMELTVAKDFKRFIYIIQSQKPTMWDSLQTIALNHHAFFNKISFCANRQNQTDG